MAEGILRKVQIVPAVSIGQCRIMPDFYSLLILVAIALTCAGFIKGVLGLGLPTVAMGLLAVTMSPGQAIAIVIVPAIVTNIWQTFGGPYLRDIFRRITEHKQFGRVWMTTPGAIADHCIGLKPGIVPGS